MDFCDHGQRNPSFVIASSFTIGDQESYISFLSLYKISKHSFSFLYFIYYSCETISDIPTILEVLPKFQKLGSHLSIEH